MRVHPLALSPVALLILACGGSKPNSDHKTPDAIITAFTVEPTTIPLGGKATLTAEFHEGVPTLEGLNKDTDKEIKLGVFEVSPDKTTTYKLTVKNAAGKPSEPQSVTLTVIPPDATITAPTSVGPHLTGYTAHVPEQHPDTGSTYTWAINEGEITSGNNTPHITFTAPAAGIVKLSCTVTNKFGAKDPKVVEIPVENGLSLNIVGLPNGV